MLGDDIMQQIQEHPEQAIDGLISIKPMGSGCHGGYNVARIYNINRFQPVVTHAHYKKQQDLAHLLADAMGVLSTHVFPNVIDDLGNDAYGKHLRIRKNRDEDHKRD